MLGSAWLRNGLEEFYIHVVGLLAFFLGFGLGFGLAFLLGVWMDGWMVVWFGLVAYSGRLWWESV